MRYHKGCLHINTHTFWTMGGMSPASCFTALASSSSSRDGMAGLPARRRRAATLIWLPGALCFESPGFFSSCVDAGRHPPSEPSVYHSRGSHAPPNPSSFPGSSQPCSTREKAAHLPGGASARAGRDARKWRRN